MSSLGSPNPFFIAGKKAYEIERSLRFNDDDGAYLQETAGTPTNNKIWTYSVWVKRTTLSGDQAILVGYSNGGSFDQILFSSSGGRNNQIFMQFNNSGTYGQFTSTRLFRDVGAWGHLVIKADTTAGSNGVTVYWNNEVVAGTWNVTLAQDATFHSLNQSGDNFRIGHLASGVANHYLDGYLAEINFVDGSALLPSSFGETNVLTGQWNPKKYVGSYGTNGFYLNFSDNSGTTATTLGKDSSGNGNNFTPNNFATTDAVKDSPTNNFCVLNINDNNLSESSPHFVYSEGNLKAAWSFTGTNFDRAYGTLFVEGSDTNKYYWEATGTQNNEQMRWGVHGTHTSSYRANNRNTNGGAETDVAVMMWQPYGSAPYLMKIDANDAGVALSTSNGNAANGDIFSFVFDGATGKFYVWFKGVELSGQDYAAGTSLFDAVDSTKTYALLNGQGDGGVSTKNGNFILNWGQDSSFAGSKTAQGNTDANGIGDFYYSVPSGAKALCSKNLPDPTIKLPNQHFNTILYTGNDSNSRDITGVGFQPDFLWIKNRSQADFHMLQDSVRGANKVVYSNDTDNEQTDNSNGHVNSFLPDGFNVDAGAQGNVNENNENYVAWNWNAGDTDGKTYTVTVVSDSGNKYRFDGYGTSAVTLDLAEGGTYIFNYPSAHPFRFSTTSDGTHGGGSEYTTGVTVISSTSIQIVVAASAPTLYYYCSSHSGMGGAINTNSTLGSSNFDGSTQSVVKASPTAGFSIINYTGTGSTATVGHGLGVTPQVVLTRSRSNGGNWGVLHTVGDPTAENRLHLNDNGGYSSYQGNYLWNDTVPNSSVFTVKQDNSTNASSRTYVAYVFSAVVGYSKFGKYTGNGITKGTFVFTGFRPAFILFKNTSRSTNWEIYDTKREPHNIALRNLYANLSSAEESHASLPALDIYSNGFKPRSAWDEFNRNGDTYVYFAFAESPFKNARAR